MKYKMAATVAFSMALILTSASCLLADTGSSDMDVPLAPSGKEYIIPIQKMEKIPFEIDKDKLKGKWVFLEFDARIDYPNIDGHNSSLEIYFNNEPIPENRLVNLPMEFRRTSGNTSAPGRWVAPRWNFDTVKTGDPLADKLIKNGGNRYMLSYADSFDVIDSDKNIHKVVDYSGHHFVFDITDLCSAGTANELVFRNNLGEAEQKIMKSGIPMIVANVKLKISNNKPEKPLPFWLKEMESENKRELSYVSPKKEWKEKYSIDVSSDGLMNLQVGGNKYSISSCFSYPHGGYNDIGGKTGEAPEKCWLVDVKKEGNNFLITGEGDYYAIKREITPHDYYIEVRDTISNRTEKDLPVIIKNELDIPKEKSAAYNLYLCGLKVTGKNVEKYYPENPTTFVGSSAGGVGLVAVDDVFRIHCKNHAENGRTGLNDRQFILPPYTEYSLRWQIFPVVSGDYCSFINNLRHCWGLNGIKANGVYRCVFKQSQCQNVIEAANEYPEISYVWGTHQYEGNCYWGYALKNNMEMHKDRKAIIAELKKGLPERVKVLACYMAPYFSNDSKRRDVEIFKDCLIVGKDGEMPEECGSYFFYPTRRNKFGAMVTEMTDMMMDDWKADGIYFDYMEGADPYYTYNTWDGHSADIDPATKELSAKKGSYQLLSQDYLIWLIRRIAGKGGVIIANRGNFTWTTTQALKELTPVRYAECGFPDQLTRGHLTPCPLGLQRTFNSIHLQVLRALYEGMLTYPYDFHYPFPNNLIADMWPFSYLEMHRGYVIGEDKIITMLSGYFGWGDDSEITCSLFDTDGKPLKNNFETVQKDGNSYMKVELKLGQVAILKRKSR